MQLLYKFLFLFFVVFFLVFSSKRRKKKNETYENNNNNKRRRRIRRRRRICQSPTILQWQGLPSSFFFVLIFFFVFSSVSCFFQILFVLNKKIQVPMKKRALRIGDKVGERHCSSSPSCSSSSSSSSPPRDVRRRKKQRRRRRRRICQSPNPSPNGKASLRHKGPLPLNWMQRLGNSIALQVFLLVLRVSSHSSPPREVKRRKRQRRRKGRRICKPPTRPPMAKPHFVIWGASTSLLKTKRNNKKETEDKSNTNTMDMGYNISLFFKQWVLDLQDQSELCNSFLKNYRISIRNISGEVSHHDWLITL